jgi:formyl-CoA transferase
MTQATAPLAGVKVVELGTLIAGPYCSSVLAQFGADVVKVESPGDGDPLRKWRKLYDGHLALVVLAEPQQEIDHAQLEVAARAGDRARAREGRRHRRRELPRRPPRRVGPRMEGVVGNQSEARDGAHLGLWPDRALQGPAGFAAIAESMGGLRYLAGYPDRPPVRVGVSIGDTLAALYGVIGALLAMHHVKVNEGKGQFIDVALYEAVFGVMESLIPEFAAFGHVRERTGASLPGISPSNTYPCKDGRYVIIAGNSDGIFKRLMNAIGRADLANDPALARNDGRVKQNEMLDEAITAWTSQHGLEEVLQTLEKAEVPNGRIYTAADIHADPHYHARQMIEKHAMPDGTPIEIPGVVPKLSDTPGGTRWLGPGLGAHTEEVLASIGIRGEAVEKLRRDGVI